jgi:hypothetical protein
VWGYLRCPQELLPFKAEPWELEEREEGRDQDKPKPQEQIHRAHTPFTMPSTVEHGHIKP